MMVLCHSIGASSRPHTGPRKLDELSRLQRKSLTRLRQDGPERPVQAVTLTERVPEVSNMQHVPMTYKNLRKHERRLKPAAWTCTCRCLVSGVLMSVHAPSWFWFWRFANLKALCQDSVETRSQLPTLETTRTAPDCRIASSSSE